MSCQAESYRGSFHCSWMGPHSAIFRARLTRRWVPQGPPPPRPVSTQPSRPPPPAATAPWGSGCRQPGAGAGSAPAWPIHPSAPSPRSCAPWSCSWRGSRTPPTSTSPSTSSSATSVSSARRHWGPGEVLGALGVLWEGSAPGWAAPPRADPAVPAVRPDPPRELTVQRRGEQLHLTWAPPASWPLPKSYFALLYRLQYELRNGTQVTAGRPSPGPAHAAPALALLRPPGPRLGSSRCRGGHWERGLTGGSARPPPHFTLLPLGCRMVTPAVTSAPRTSATRTQQPHCPSPGAPRVRQP